MVQIKLQLVCVVLFLDCVVIYSLMSDKFDEIRKSPYYIDKTNLIKEILNVDEPLILTAPDGFGKTTNLDMVRHFFNTEPNMTHTMHLFEGTGISNNKQIMNHEFGNYTVLHCSFKPDRPIFSYYTFILSFRTMLYRTFTAHSYLIRSRKLTRYDKKKLSSYTGVKKHLKLKSYEIIVGLYFLAKLLKKHHNNQVIVVIDDYDYHILDGIFMSDINLDYVLGMHNVILSTLVHNNNYVDKIVMAGSTCTCIKRLVHMDKVRCIGFLQNKAFAPFFGITEHELEKLLSKERFHNKRSRKDEIKDWYNGYVSPDLETHVYNTRWTLSFLESGEFQRYWVGHRAIKTIKNLLIEPYVQDILDYSVFYKKPIEIIYNDSVRNDDIKMLRTFTDYELWNEDYGGTFLYLLMEEGYFTFAESCDLNVAGPKTMSIKIPNNEVGEIFRQINATLFANPIEILDRLKDAIHQISYCEKTEIFDALLDITAKPEIDPSLMNLTLGELS